MPRHTERPAAGRPLDLALARAMRWQVVVIPDGAVWTTGLIERPIVASDGSLAPLLAWSTDQAAAWQLAAELRLCTSYDVSVWSPDGSCTRWAAGVRQASTWVEDSGASRAEAISRALLLCYAFGWPALV